MSRKGRQVTSHAIRLFILLLDLLAEEIHFSQAWWHAFSPVFGKQRLADLLSSRPTWSTKEVLGQPGLHRGTPSQKDKSSGCVGGGPETDSCVLN